MSPIVDSTRPDRRDHLLPVADDVLSAGPESDARKASVSVATRRMIPAFTSAFSPVSASTPRSASVSSNTLPMASLSSPKAVFSIMSAPKRSSSAAATTSSIRRQPVLGELFLRHLGRADELGEYAPKRDRTLGRVDVLKAHGRHRAGHLPELDPELGGEREHRRQRPGECTRDERPLAGGRDQLVRGVGGREYVLSVYVHGARQEFRDRAIPRGRLAEALAASPRILSTASPR